MGKPTEPQQPEIPPTPAPEPWDVLSRLATAMESISQKLANAPATDMGTLMELQGRLASALERVSEASLEGSKLIADETRRAHRPSNEVVPQISVFNRRGVLVEGYEKPKLRCTMMIPWLAENEMSTREEVELLNLLEAGEYTLKRTDNTKVRVSVEMTYRVDGKTPSRLLLTHDTAFNNDHFTLIPPLPDMLRQLLKQHRGEVRRAAAEILTDEEEEALIEAGQLTVSV